MREDTAVLASRDRRIAVAGVIGFAVALAAASQVAIPVPGTSVPMTLQPLAVVLAGICLGPGAGAASMVLYLAAGAAGLPVFAPEGLPGAARLVGPTGGYLLAYPLGAFAAGGSCGTARADSRGARSPRRAASRSSTLAAWRSSPSSREA